jgi:hypothetical protein
VGRWQWRVVVNVVVEGEREIDGRHVGVKRGGGVHAYVCNDRGGGGGCGACVGRWKRLVVVNAVVDGERRIDGGHVRVKRERVFHVQVRDHGTFFQQ